MASSVLPTKGIVTTLTFEELAAISELGFGAPAVLPEVAERSQPATLDELRSRLLVDEANRPLPWFSALWSIVVQPRLLVLVSRIIEGEESAWLYYIATDGFVEQVNRSDSVALLGASLDQLADRICLTSGLLRGRTADGHVLDPLDCDTFDAHVRVTRIGGATHEVDFKSSRGRLTMDGEPVDLKPVVEALGTALKRAFHEAEG